jgi:peptidoglycan hydrolase-like protein with peptidoglycan-binding domain
MNHDVMPLQTALIANGYLPLLNEKGKRNDDGIFGTTTRNAMNAYQFAHHLRQSQQPTLATCLALGITLPDFPLEPEPQVRNSPMQNILGGLFSGLFKNLLSWQLVQGYIRSGLITLGGWVGLDGWVGHEGGNTIIGAVMVILAVVWQAVENNTKKKALDVVKAVDAHPEIEVIPASETAANKPIVTVPK